MAKTDKTSPTTMYLDVDVKRDLQAWSDASEVPKVRTVNRAIRLHMATLLGAASPDMLAAYVAAGGVLPTSTAPTKTT